MNHAFKAASIPLCNKLFSANLSKIADHYLTFVTSILQPWPMDFRIRFLVNGPIGAR
jgi:hypothetical protein